MPVLHLIRRCCRCRCTLRGVYSDLPRRCSAVSNAGRPRGGEVELGRLNRLFLLRAELKVCFETRPNLNFELIFSSWRPCSCSGFSAASSRRGLAGGAGARLSGVCFRVKLCGFGLMSLAGMHLLRSDILQAKVKYTPYCITTEKLRYLRY